MNIGLDIDILDGPKNANTKIIGRMTTRVL